MTPPQLELDLARPAPKSLRARAAQHVHTALLWTPVWVPFLFLGQLLWLGLRPARAASARLDRSEAEVRARVESLGNEERELAAEARMLDDAVYQERVRRSLVDPEVAPLTLERAREHARP